MIAELKQAGFVKRKIRMTPHGQTSNEYDLSGLVKKLQLLVPDFQQAKGAKLAAEKKGGLKSKNAS